MYFCFPSWQYSICLSVLARFFVFSYFSIVSKYIIFVVVDPPLIITRTKNLQLILITAQSIPF